MPLIRISNISLTDLYDIKFWDNILSINDRISLEEKPYQTLWQALSPEASEEYFFSDENVFYQWLDMLNTDQLNAYADIILADGELFLDDDPEYNKLMDNMDKVSNNNTKQPSIESLGVISTFHDLFNEIKGAVHKYGAVITYQANTIILAANQLNKLNDLKHDILSTGYVISHRMTLEDVITQKDIVIYTFTLYNPICLS